MKNISPVLIENSMSYAEYRQKIDTLMEDGKATGDNHSEAILHYTKMNVARMRRLDKTTRLTEESLEQLAKIESPQVWLVLTEGWCGDAAQIIPVMEKMAAESANISLHYILRDENLEVMDSFLTNGARSIPKLIVMDKDNLEVKTTWGPRPAEVQKMVMNSKEDIASLLDKDKIKERTEAIKYDVQKWYAKDKTKKIQKELLENINNHF